MNPLALPTPADRRDAPRALHELPQGAARDSQLAVHALLATRLPTGNLAIYEAGGGSTCFLPPSLLRRAHVTVVDINPVQLANNGYAQAHILADIQTHRFASDSFDLVTCYNVIEHLADVEATLDGFRTALRRGGLILIGAPNPRSLSGLVTRHSPHWFHVWFYRYMRGEPNAGEPGQPPFPTVFHPLVALPRLEAYAETHGLEVIYRKDYESPRYPELRLRRPWLARLVDGLATALNLFMPAGADVRNGDYHLILRKH